VDRSGPQGRSLGGDGSSETEREHAVIVGCACDVMCRVLC
jgi:hypothetical protein